MTDTPADDQAALLASWVAALAADLEAAAASTGSALDPSARLDVRAIDIDAVLSLAGAAAHSVVRPAAPLTTFVVGYAAGLAVAAGADPAEALKQAAEAAAAAAERWRAEHRA